MSRPQLVLKQSTGWFAAGWQFAQALEELSDPAFQTLRLGLPARRPAHGPGAEQRVGARFGFEEVFTAPT
jgi:hypothetical protein